MPRKVAGSALPKGKSFLMVEETGIGKGFPFSAEKLSVTMTLYKYKEFSGSRFLASLAKER